MCGPLLQHSSDWSTLACREDIFKEIDILVGMNHENVIYLKEYFEEGDKVGPRPQECIVCKCRDMFLKGSSEEKPRWLPELAAWVAVLHGGMPVVADSNGMSGTEQWVLLKKLLKKGDKVPGDCHLGACAAAKHGWDV